MTAFDHAFSLARGALGVLVLCGVAGAAPADANEAEVPRVVRSSFYAQDGRAQVLPDRISLDERGGASSVNGKPGRRSESQKSASARSQAPNTEFWFYDVDVQLFADEDLDGYYYGIDLLFDADTVYEYADVYAVLYLSREGGPWYEYAETEVFPLQGATSDDDFVVVSELLSGYPAGSYDILIELYDTWDNAFVAEFGPYDTTELGYLPLEDAERDTPWEPPFVEEGGGSADPQFLGMLLAVLIAGLALRRPRPTCVRVRAGNRREPRA